MDCFGTAVSMSLQYGVPLEVYVNKFSYTRFEPWGYTNNPEIRVATSIVDYIFRWLGIMFLPGYREQLRSRGAGAAAVTEKAGAASPAGQGSGGGNEQAPLQAAAPSRGIEPEKTRSVAAPTGDGEFRQGKSIPVPLWDYPIETASSSAEGMNSPVPPEGVARYQDDNPICDNCGAITRRAGNCFLCGVCGTSMGCS